MEFDGHADPVPARRFLNSHHARLTVHIERTHSLGGRQTEVQRLAECDWQIAIEESTSYVGVPHVRQSGLTFGIRAGDAGKHRKVYARLSASFWCSAQADWPYL